MHAPKMQCLVSKENIFKLVHRYLIAKSIIIIIIFIYKSDFVCLVYTHAYLLWMAIATSHKRNPPFPQSDS